MPERLEELGARVKETTDVVNEIFRDTIGDYRESGKRKDYLIGLLIAVIFGVSMFSVYQMKCLSADNDARFKDFLSQYEFDNTQSILVEGAEGETTNYGSINK